MDRRLSLIALAAIPVLAAIFHVLTRVSPPLTGYALGLCCYWLFLAVILWRETTPAQRSEWLVARPPGNLIGALCLLPVFVVGVVGMAKLDSVPSALLLPIALAAITNAVLEELFWRGAILPRPDRRAAALAVILFASWHLALFAANGIVLTGGPVVLLGGAALLGAIWMAARMRTGSVGTGVLSHAGVNLFAFIELVARNLA